MRRQSGSSTGDGASASASVEGRIFPLNGAVTLDTNTLDATLCIPEADLSTMLNLGGLLLGTGRWRALP